MRVKEQKMSDRRTGDGGLLLRDWMSDPRAGRASTIAGF